MSAVLRVLRTRNFPILQQLRIEEALLRTSEDNWLLINDGCSQPAIVLGISGKVEEHVHLHEARSAGVQLIRRFSGGGTVVVDKNTIFTTMIMQRASLPDVKPFPREIMGYTDPTRVPRTRQKAALTFESNAELEVLENDYVVGKKKIAGNAQAIVKDRWLHHTSWLWDISSARMALLQEPARRPAYRGNRTHGTFMMPLVAMGCSREDLLETIEDAFFVRGFQLEEADLAEAEEHLQRAYLRSVKILSND